MTAWLGLYTTAALCGYPLPLYGRPFTWFVVAPCSGVHVMYCLSVGLCVASLTFCMLDYLLANVAAKHGS